VAGPLPWDLRLLTGAFLVSGAVHLVAPRVFEPLVPRWLPARRALVLGSGVAELGCAAGLLHPATRRTAGLASAVLLVAVFPGNVQMALDARGRSPAYRAATVARLPLQLPLVRTALGAAGSRSRTVVGLA
jgi:uncharacterized membrane protein